VSNSETSIVSQIPGGVRWAILSGFGVCIWAYWPTLSEAARYWLTDPQYSHGYLVPAFAGVLFWLRREHFRNLAWGFHLEGMFFLATGTLMRLGNLITYSSAWIDGLAFVVSLAGVLVLAGGGNILRGAWPAIGFLMFMFPLPYRIERILGGELQALATQVSTGLLQVIGLPAVAEGNTILIDEIRLGVAEACSGLGMLLIFVALGFAFAAVVDRPLLDRAILVASTVPIAVIANVCRITVTGLLHVWVGSRLADLVFHDLAGWLMMPFALGLLWAEMKFLTYVLVEEQVPEAIEIAFGVQPEKS
jgi:exosortase